MWRVLCSGDPLCFLTGFWRIWNYLIVKNIFYTYIPAKITGFCCLYILSISFPFENWFTRVNFLCTCTFDSDIYVIKFKFIASRGDSGSGGGAWHGHPRHGDVGGRDCGQNEARQRSQGCPGQWQPQNGRKLCGQVSLLKIKVSESLKVK